MKKWIIANQKHLIVWAVLLLYVVSANQLYVIFFLKDGKPVSKNDPLPLQDQNRQIIYQLSDFMQPVSRNGQSLYQLDGFAFFKDSPFELTQIQIVLVSSTLKLTFPTHPVQFPDMIRSMAGYQPGMDKAQFNLLFSKNTLKPGTYQICILLTGDKGEQAYVMTVGNIVKTPNTITYNPAP